MSLTPITVDVWHFRCVYTGKKNAIKNITDIIKVQQWMFFVQVYFSAWQGRSITHDVIFIVKLLYNIPFNLLFVSFFSLFRLSSSVQDIFNLLLRIVVIYIYVTKTTFIQEAVVFSTTYPRAYVQWEHCHSLCTHTRKHLFNELFRSYFFSISQ